MSLQVLPTLPARRATVSYQSTPGSAARRSEPSAWAARRLPDPRPASKMLRRPPSTASVRALPSAAGRRSCEPFLPVTEGASTPHFPATPAIPQRSPPGSVPTPASAMLPRRSPSSPAPQLVLAPTPPANTPAPPPPRRRMSLSEDVPRTVPAAGPRRLVAGRPVLPDIPARADPSRRRDSDEKEEVPALRYPFNSNMVSEKGAETVFADLQRVLRGKQVVFSTSGALCLHCVWGDLLFEAEIVRIPRLQNMHGIHFRRLKGDAVAYKQLCTALIEAVQL